MEEKICPCCGRHCNLESPHCGRGEEYAKTGVIPVAKHSGEEGHHSEDDHCHGHHHGEHGHHHGEHGHHHGERDGRCHCGHDHGEHDRDHGGEGHEEQ